MVNSLPGEIFIAPRIIYWVAMPKTIGKDIILEMLKRDVLIIPIEYSEVESKKYSEAVYLYNLDKLQTLMGVNAKPGEYEKQLIKKILSHSPSYSIVHTGQISAPLKNLFASAKVSYLEKNLRDLDVAKETLDKIMQGVFKKVYDTSRAFLRIEMHPTLNIRITVKRDETENRNLFLRDLSLNGFKIGAKEVSDLNWLAVKDVVEMTINLPTSVVRLSNVIVTRVEEQLKQVAVSYNLNNKFCISKEHANSLAQVVHDWLVDVVNQKEGDPELDFTRITGSINS